MILCKSLGGALEEVLVRALVRRSCGSCGGPVEILLEGGPCTKISSSRMLVGSSGMKILCAPLCRSRQQVLRLLLR